MSLATDYALISNIAFKGRVIAAILRAAADIRNQTTNLPSNHASRLAWAKSVSNLGVADQAAGWMTPLIVCADADLRYAFENGQPGAEPPIAALDQLAVGDASIINGVNALIDDYAEEQFPE